jgi:hypothetical protein
MTALSVQPPYPILTDIDGQPLENGFIFIGVVNLAPITNQITVYWDAALTVTATQPIRTRGGFPMNGNVPGRLYVNSDYSIQVQNLNGSTVYSAPEATEALGNIISFAEITGTLGSDRVTFLQAGTSAVTRTAQAKMRDEVNVKDFGAVGNGVANDTAAFSAAAAASAQNTVSSGTYLLNSNPTANMFVVQKGASFTGAGTLNTVTGKVLSYGGAFRSLESNASFYAGIFGYLEQNAALSGYGTIGLHGFVRSAGGTGGAAEANIAVAGCAVHDLSASAGGVWALYGTAVRQSGVNGATHSLEIDIANMGSTVALFPHAMFSVGSTSCAWICTGGEITASGAGSPGVASCAIGIVQNDSQVVKTAKYDKGIVFHNLAINGADGATGIGVAIAFAVGHAMQWYNNSAQVIGEIVSTGVVQASNNYRLDFSDFGLLLQDRSSGATAFQVEKTVNGVNGISVRPGATGVPGEVVAIGSDTNIDLQLRAKGTGLIKFGTRTASADVLVTGYVEIKTDDGITRKLAVVG